ncbi:excalibur calcium-binding domain-containing protein [Streptomyces rhizosphaerihabitans]|uniref:excalibur calcium-binding domain-containing protein n=1 Tax=Streptomyces rhizosphaerihabitans TaxID=1266770 RepID=UPI0021BF3BB3|nr:excalibur calcium-binding domain-containing protein [Streptomyces rhizosphaerihabitans]MCT9010003.1 excalibur calcium-binding domain-containing protein [Streptomyces rhizosphaerihabitans]
MGLWAKVAIAVVGLVIGFAVLGGLLEACDAGGEGPQQLPTSSSSAESSSSTTDVPASPTPKKEEPERPAVTVTETATASEEPVEPTTSAPEEGAYYENCDAARAAGAAPLHRGDPGYRDELDRDGDGVACEPYR